MPFNGWEKPVRKLVSIWPAFPCDLFIGKVTYDPPKLQLIINDQ